MNEDRSMDIDDALSDLIRDEGIRLKPYRDTVAKLTIGIGRNLDDVGISIEEAYFLARNDVERAIVDLDALSADWRSFPAPVRRGLINMCFNLGRSRLAGFRKMWAALERQDWGTAASEALESKWAYQVGGRATRIADLFRTAKEAKIS